MEKVVIRRDSGRENTRTASCRRIRTDKHRGFNFRNDLPNRIAERLPFPEEPRNLDFGTRCLERGKGGAMSAFEDHKDELRHYEQMLGAHRGRLAVTLDRVTNAMVLVGQHGVYCHSQRDPTKPTMDIQIITEELRKAKELIQSVMEDLRVERENRLRAN